jgi:hypothetical protein
MIDVFELIGDSLYQVNVILLMLQPSAVSPIKPIFQEVGIELTTIEQPLPFPVELANQLGKKKIGVRNPVTPDLILKSPKKEFIIFECKKSMFGSITPQGSDDGHIKQARSCLLQVPKVLASALTLQEEDISNSSLVYLSRHPPAHTQTLGLSEIAEQLNKNDLPTIEFGLLGLSQDSNNIYLNSNYSPSYLPTEIKTKFSGSPIIIQEIDDPSNDPRVYYHIPWMPGSSDTKSKDKYSEIAFGNAILQHATISIAKATPPSKVIPDIESLISLATNGFYQKWRNKEIRSQLIINTKKLLRKVLLSSSTKPELNYIGSVKGWEVNIQDKKVQSHIIEAMRKWKDQDWMDQEQPALFPMS